MQADPPFGGIVAGSSFSSQGELALTLLKRPVIQEYPHPSACALSPSFAKLRRRLAGVAPPATSTPRTGTLCSDDRMAIQRQLRDARWGLTPPTFAGFTYLLNASRSANLMSLPVLCLVRQR